MEVVIFGMLALALAKIAVVLCAKILRKAGRPATIPKEFNARFAVFEQVGGALTGRSMQGFGIKWSYTWPS